MLTEIFNIQKGDVVSITGASGKTSLMFKLSRELRDAKVLVTTTTNIYIPEEGTYDFMYIDCDINVNTGITVIAESVSPAGKLSGYGERTLSEITGLFDYTLIESDGSKGKPLKAWNDYEPVIVSKTTKTIGIINVKHLGCEISDNYIHRPEIFRRNFSGDDKILELDHLVKIITHKDGLFKNSEGERILYINQVESPLEVENSKRLAALLSDRGRFLGKIVYGSIKNNNYKCLG